MKKKGWIIGMLSVAFVILLIVTGGNEAESAAPAGGTITLTLAHTSSPGTPIFATYARFKDALEKNSKGKIKVNVHPQSSLGGDVAQVEGAKRGSIDIGSCGTNNLSPFTTLYMWADMPYVFKNIDGVHKVYGGPIGEEFKKKFEDEQKDIKVLFYADPGDFRNFMNTKREVKTPADAKGLKLRTAASPVEQAIVRAFGASPTPINWPEVYMSLEQKVVDGELQQYHWIVTAMHQELIKYITECGGQHALHLAIMSRKTWDKLTPDLQKVVTEAAKDAQKYNFDNAAKLNDGLRQIVLKAGVKIYRPTPEEYKSWENAAKVVWTEFQQKVPMELIDRVRKAQE